MNLKIGEFAAMCHVSVRTLHLYDRLGLIHPAWVDEASGYRYYAPEQAQLLNTIVSFKKVGFTLSEVKQMVDSGLSRELVITRLSEKRLENERAIQRCQYNVENIATMLAAMDAPPERPDPEAEAVRISRIACLENDKLEHDFSQILWL